MPFRPMEIREETGAIRRRNVRIIRLILGLNLDGPASNAIWSFGLALPLNNLLSRSD